MQEYFALQLNFAERVAEHLAMPLAESVLLHTNLYRRFNLGNPDDASNNADWQSYQTKLELLTSHAERVAWTQSFFQTCSAKQETPSPFGCFSLELRGEIVRAHFTNQDADTLSPLHASKEEKRKAELKALFSYAKTHHPEAKEVMGVSWLYNSTAYRQLFPTIYIESREVRKDFARFQGSSSWGQFINHKQELKLELKEQFLRNLVAIESKELWQLFPLGTFVLRAPVEVFYEHYGLLR